MTSCQCTVPVQDALEWKAYCHFHNGEHDKALECYENLLKDPNPDPMFHLYAGCCHFYMGENESRASPYGPDVFCRNNPSRVAKG